MTNIEGTLDELLTNEDLKDISFPRDSLETLKVLTSRSPEDVIRAGLHEYIDEVQVALLAFGAQVAATFFYPD